MKSTDILAILAGAAICAGLYFLAGYAERVKSTKWKLFWLAPVVTHVIAKSLDISLMPLYLGILIAATGFFTEQKSVRRKTGIAAAAVMLLAFPVCLLNPRYRAVDYKGDFQKGFDTMREHYVLTAHKGIDWDALYAKYMPLFEEADREQNAEKNYLAWAGFCGEFHDGHVGVTADWDSVDEAARQVLGNDYGLAVMRMTDGRFAAVNADASLKQYGIQNGTVITKWDGQSPETVSRNAPAWNKTLLHKNAETKKVTEIGCYPDIDNELFFSAMYAGGIGGETVAVSYLDENGNEQTVTLPKIGDYADRLFQTVEIIEQGVDLGNLEWKRLDKTTACLRITGMMFDMKSYNSEEEKDYQEMQDEIRSAYQLYKAQGVRDVIIDLRNNGGGSPVMVNAVASLFSPAGDYFCSADGVWDEENLCWKTDEHGNYLSGKTITCHGADMTDGAKVILLVNSSCVSAGDYMVKTMRRLPHVTAVGFTEPNGSCQAVGQTSFSGMSLSFSNCVNLDEDGRIFIDSGADRQSTNGIDVQIPFDQTAIHALFDDGQDYAMQQALAILHEEND